MQSTNKLFINIRLDLLERIVNLIIIVFRTNLPKEIMLFPDFPFYDDSLPSYPTHREIVTYFKRYCKHFQLDKFIEFGKLVEQVTPIPLLSSAASNSLDTVQWRVTTKSQITGDRKSEVFDFIFGCSG